MRKIYMVLVMLVLALTQGCGTWCANNHSTCVEGFTGFSRYPDFGGQYYYPFSVLTVQNSGNKENCVIDVIIDGDKMAAGIEKGTYRRIEIKSPPNENRPATVLVNRRCGGKPAGSYSNTIYISSVRSASYTWVMDDRYFPQVRVWR